MAGKAEGRSVATREEQSEADKAEESHLSRSSLACSSVPERQAGTTYGQVVASTSMGSLDSFKVTGPDSGSKSKPRARTHGRCRQQGRGRHRQVCSCWTVVPGGTMRVAWRSWVRGRSCRYWGWTRTHRTRVPQVRRTGRQALRHRLPVGLVDQELNTVRKSPDASICTPTRASAPGRRWRG